jgi:hypothetical protein
MQIISIILTGYRRFLAGGTKSITYTPESAIQLITATNGAGKSSLLAELSPLPASQQQFIKGGKKVITINHRGSHYVLTSDFTKGNHHYFEKDGVNLNQGRTGSVQKILVEQEFNYTNEIHDIQLGKTKFTQLAPNKRREVLTLLCKTDVTYATDVYTRLASQARNLVGARKHTEEKIVQYRSNMIAENELFDIREKLNALQAEYLQLGQNKFRDVNVDQLSKFKQLLIDSSTALIDRTNTLDRKFQQIPDYESDIQNIEQQINSTQNKLTTLGNEHTTLSSLLEQLQSNDTRSILELKTEILELQETLTSLPIPNIPIMSYDLVLDSAIDAANAINDLLLKIPLNPNMQLYSRETIPTSRTELTHLINVKTRALKDIENAESRLQLIQNHAKSECPDCGYTWIPGLSEKEVTNLNKVITDSQKTLESLVAPIEKLTEFLNQAEEWKLWYSKYRSITIEYPRLQYIWDYLQDDYRLFNEPAKHVGLINKFIEDLKTANYRKTLTDNLNTLEHLIVQKQRTESANLGVLSSKLIELEKHISTQTDILSKLKIELQSVISELRLANDFLNHTKTIMQYWSLYEQALINNNKISINAQLDTMMFDYSQQMSLLSDKVEKAKHSIDLVAHLDLTLKELTEDEEIYQLLLKELSPTDGLIAKSLYQFIQLMVNQCNEIIRSIWTTHLQIQPCRMEKDQLNYKFPLEFPETDYPVEDISEGSEGQQDFIDFVFKIVSRLHLGLLDYPLLMDEVGRSFSEEHRLRLFEYIKKLVELDLTKQVFVVSHFPSTHGTLTLADRNVLDPSGVMVLPGDNKNFIIT